MAAVETEREPDRFAGTPHPRDRFVLFGHEAAERSFLEAFRTGRTPHAWLIGGEEGIGKATLAYRVALFILTYSFSDQRSSTSLEVEPDHRMARLLAAQSHPDVTVLRRELTQDRKNLATTISVESVRQLNHRFANTASEGGWRVCILDSADDLNASGANALLKLIEEPPPLCLFLIIAHAPQRVLPTIRSRCRKLMLKPLNDGDLDAAILSLGPPWSQADPQMRARAIALSGGSVRKALTLLDPQRLALIDQTHRLLEALPREKLQDVLALSERITRKGEDEAYDAVLATIAAWVSGQLHTKAGEGVSHLAPLLKLWENMQRSIHETDIYNLDKRSFIVTLLGDCAEAVRRRT